MNEDHLTTLFGDLTLVQALLWFSAAFAVFGAFVGAIVLLWKKISAFVGAVNTLVGLQVRLKAIDEKLDKMPGLESTLERVRAQVENDHRHPDGTPIIMRDEQDQRHAEIMTSMTGLQKQIGRVEDRVDAVNDKVDRTNEKVDRHLEWSAEWSRDQERADRELDDRLDGLENTIDPRKEP